MKNILNGGYTGVNRNLKPLEAFTISLLNIQVLKVNGKNAEINHSKRKNFPIHDGRQNSELIYIVSKGVFKMWSSCSFLLYEL
jgi:hypothetical protein